MFYADYHTHSGFSSDSSTPMERNIEQAIALGLREIAITDHIDFDFPDPNYPFILDYSTYARRINDVRSKFSERIKIVLGVEIGLQPHVYSQITEFAENNHFDFIIGSTHCVEKFDLCANDFFEGKTKHEAYARYFEDVLYNIKNCPVFNVYGHIDFINRYGSYKDKSMDYSEFDEILTKILEELISRGKGIEINTSGFRYGLGVTHPQFQLVKKFHSMGGEIITVGSDAHIPEDITKDFRTAYDILKKAGFNYITTFDNLKPKFVKI